MNYTVTITREFGSLGRPIAKAMAEKLGIMYYDRDIVEKTAKKMDLPVSTISDVEESAKSAFSWMGYPLGMGTTDVQDQIFAEQSKIIRDIAERESCIIVGRCSDYVLEDKKNNINIYIYAPYDVRFRNCTDILKMSREEAKAMIAKVDKARISYHRRYAKFLPNDEKKKDIMINSGLLGVDGTARILTELVKERFGL